MQIDRLTDLGAGFEPGPARDAIVAQFNRAAHANSEAGAEVVIAAGGVVMALLAHADIHQTEDGLPILNGITNLVKLGEVGGEAEPHHGRALHLQAVHLRCRRRPTKSRNSASTTARISTRR